MRHHRKPRVKCLLLKRRPHLLYSNCLNHRAPPPVGTGHGWWPVVGVNPRVRLPPAAILLGPLRRCRLLWVHRLLSPLRRLPRPARHGNAHAKLKRPHPHPLTSSRHRRRPVTSRLRRYLHLHLHSEGRTSRMGHQHQHRHLHQFRHRHLHSILRGRRLAPTGMCPEAARKPTHATSLRRSLDMQTQTERPNLRPCSDFLTFALFTSAKAPAKIAPAKIATFRSRPWDELRHRPKRCYAKAT